MHSHVVELAHHPGKFGQEMSRYPGEIHPPDLDVGRLPGEIVGVEIGQRGLEDALAIGREVLALREHERDRKHRQETVLYAVRRAAPRIVDLADRHGALGVGAQERPSLVPTAGRGCRDRRQARAPESPSPRRFADAAGSSRAARQTSHLRPGIHRSQAALRSHDSPFAAESAFRAAMALLDGSVRARSSLRRRGALE